jgi:hypothetical protein
MKKYISPWIAATKETERPKKIFATDNKKILFVKYALGEKDPIALIQYHDKWDLYYCTFWKDKYTTTTLSDINIEYAKIRLNIEIDRYFITLPIDRFEKLAALI